jgi:hypothetical protein
MYDSTTASDLPAGAPMLLAYVDGIDTHNNYNEVRALHPNALIVKCTVTGGTLDAQVGDIESGDMTPQSGAGWAHRKVAAGQHPTLYMNESTWPAVKAAVHAVGLDGKVSYLVAHYDDRPVIPAGAIGKQYIDHGPHGEHYDVSIVADYWPGVDPVVQTTGPLPWWYRRPLRYLSVGQDVGRLKAHLRLLGYGGTNRSWLFGRGLRSAVRTFQRDHHLVVDGVVGPITARAIRASF